jgi:maleylpyruvate isomerase
MTALYSYWRSSASWRVRIALALKGVEYEYRAVHLVKDGGEQHSELYHLLNPARLLPTLEIDGHRISESLAILRYLDETRPEPPLVPRDPYLAAKAWQIAEMINAGTQPLQNLRVMQRLGTQFGASPDEQRAWSAHWIGTGLEAVETLLAEIDGVFCVGNDVTVADLCLVPQVYNARRFGVDLSDLPHILTAEATLSSLPAFEAAHPDAQPDAQPA